MESCKEVKADVSMKLMMMKLGEYNDELDEFGDDRLCPWCRHLANWTKYIRRL